ncbi:MAG: tRNA 2-thiouridine(34) synthase MnmA [Mycoplasmataceae bacterium]|nr:tRNA 2-thiouridine(34) synthase MnmA [Mycoplasmataceae bacterium]
MLKKKRVVLGISGGVDSSVCAYLLQKQGYEVIGVFMQNWDNYVNNDFFGHTKNEDKQCNVYKDFSDVEKVSKILNFKVYKVDFIKEYWDNVFQYTIEEYKKGETPNPDVLCNKYIKFGSFLKYAKEKFNCDLIAMGHYAGSKIINKKKYLTLAKDSEKDQTYFLCWINQQQLDKCLFPLEKYTKKEVREIAAQIGLPNHDKTESTGICFIGERKFTSFLQNYIKPKEGDVIDIVTKKKVGTHIGIMYYTIGQNKQLHLGGLLQKYYVCLKDKKKNIIYVVSEEEKEKFLSSEKCVVKDFNWINEEAPKEKEVLIRFRHRQTLIKGTFEIKKDNIILQYEKTLSVTNGQFAVLYQNGICLGGGIVKKVILCNK